MAKKQTRKSISINRATYDRLKAYCEDNHISMSQLVEARVSDALDASSHPLEAPSASASDGSPSLTPTQSKILARCLRIGFGELQRRIARGDEDGHLAEMIETFEAYFAVGRARLRNDRVPTSTWETYEAIRQRSALVEGSRG